jgi:hypothetical protein
MRFVINRSRLLLHGEFWMRGGWFPWIPFNQSALGRQLGTTRGWPGHCVFVTMQAVILMAADSMVNPCEVTPCKFTHLTSLELTLASDSDTHFAQSNCA